jgi:hypothetical protein
MWHLRFRVVFVLYLTIATFLLITHVQAFPSIHVLSEHISPDTSQAVSPCFTSIDIPSTSSSSKSLRNIDEESLINVKRGVYKRVVDETTSESGRSAPGPEADVQAAIDEMKRAHKGLVEQFSPTNRKYLTSRIEESNRIRAQHVAKIRDPRAAIPQKVTAALGLHEEEKRMHETGLTSGRELYFEGHRPAVDAARAALANAEPHITRLAESGETNSGYELLTTLKTHLEQLLAETPVEIPKLVPPYLPVP